MASLETPRRYYLRKRLRAVNDERDMALVWQSKQEAEPGVSLPADFPFADRLVEYGYTTREDLDGADECELTELDFSSREAREILTAYAEL